MKIIHTEPRASEEAAEIVRGLGWDVRNDQIEAGSFAGMCDTALGADAQFHLRRFNRTVVVHGVAPRDMVSLGVFGADADAASLCGSRITVNTICVVSDEDPGVMHVPANQPYTTFCLTHEVFNRTLCTMAHFVPDLRTGVLPVPESFMPPLRRLLNEAMVPSQLPDNILVERVLASISLAITTAAPAPRTFLASRNRWRYVRQARSYLCEHPGEAPGLKTLCRVTGVGARTLEAAFREVTGISPLQFSRVRRLNAARHVLATGDPEDVSVKSAALSHGFWHLGRFAHDYKMLFGESPSATLGSLRRVTSFRRRMATKALFFSSEHLQSLES